MPHEIDEAEIEDQPERIILDLNIPSATNNSFIMGVLRSWLLKRVWKGHNRYRIDFDGMSRADPFA